MAVNGQRAAKLYPVSEKLKFICVYKPWWPCYTCPWYKSECCCENSFTPNCYQQNVIFVEDSLPMPMSLIDCQNSCRSSSSCKFFTYSSTSGRCGLRFYSPSSTVFSPGQQSGTKTSILAPGEVFVGRTELISNPFECQFACQKDPNCISVTWSNFFSGNKKIQWRPNGFVRWD